MNETASYFDWQSATTWPAFVALACLTLAGLAAVRTARTTVRTLGDAGPGGEGAARDRWQLVRRLSLALSLGTLLLLTLAVLDFRHERRQSADPAPVVVLVDESASVRRDDELRRRQLDEFSSRLTAALETPGTQPADSSQQDGVRLVRFSGTPVAPRAVPLSQLTARLFSSELATGGTNIAAALERASEALEQSGGRGAIVLCSDGNQTTGDALAAARRLAARGIAVHVFPIESPGPALFLHGVSAPSTVRPAVTPDKQAKDKPRDNESDHAEQPNGVVRGLIRNSSSSDRRATLQLRYHHNDPNGSSPLVLPQGQSVASTFAAGGTGGLRKPLTFRGRGLQCVEVKLTPDGANPEVTGTPVGTHRVTLPVYVQGRPRVLVIGNDTLWTGMIDGGRWDVVTSRPADALKKLTSGGADFDAVVLSAVHANRLGTELHAELRRQVEQSGTGLLLINGDHAQASEKDPSVLMSYLKTELEPVLPVKPGPREPANKPPARRVVITVDASDSMDWPAGNGTRMQAAHGVCWQIISKLRPIDTLEMIVFDDVTRIALSRTRMTPAGKALARRKVSGIAPNNGTNAQSTLDTIGGLNLTDGALVMIGDGDMADDYGQKLRKRIGPKVYTMAFGAGLSQIDQSHPMYHFDGRMAIPDAANLPGIEFKPVESKKREKFFERKSFLPGLRVLDDQDRARGWLPPLTLPGHAVATLSSRPGTRLIGLHPDNSDPILVFGDAGRGRVGVLASGIPGHWHADGAAMQAGAAKQAVAAWLEEVSAFGATDRYWMNASLSRDRLDMRLVAFAGKGRVAPLDGANVTIRVNGEDYESNTLRPDERGLLTNSWSFHSPLPPGDVHLVIEEYGDRGVALSRPQRIPVLLPPDETQSAVVSDEDWTQGVNRRLLADIAAAGNGRLLDDDEPWPELLTAPERQSVSRFWQPLSAAGSLALVAAVFLSSVGRKW